MGGPEAGGDSGSLTAAKPAPQQIPAPNGAALPTDAVEGAEATGTLAAGSSRQTSQRESGPSGGGGSDSDASMATAGQAKQAISGTTVAAAPPQKPTASSPGEGDQAGGKTQGPGRSGIQMVRPIRLYVTSDQVVVLPDRAQSPEEGARIAASSQRIEFAGPTAVQINQVVAALKSHAESWGIAGQGMYWEPRLVLNVTSGGQGRAAELTRLLEAAGLKVQAKPVATAAKPGAPGGSNATR